MKIRARIVALFQPQNKLFLRLKHANKTLVVISSCVVLLLLIKGCSALFQANHKQANSPLLIRKGMLILIPEQSPLRKQLVVKPVNVKSLPHIVNFPGVVEAEPSLTVNIQSPLSGRLSKLYVGVGQHVKKNQMLALITSPPLAQAYADRDKALSVFNLANETLKRAQKVYKAGGNAVKDIELASSSYQQAAAELKRTQFTLKAFGNKNFSQFTIKAPISGTITALNYGIGSYINDPTNPLLTISNIESVWITANIPENIVGSIAINQRVKIKLFAYPDHPISSTIAFINSFLEPDTRRNKTRISLANPNYKLQPNMYATVSIYTTPPQLIMVPNSAILMNDDTTTVYVEKQPWVFEARKVVLGSEDSYKVRVLSGLNPNERVVISGGILVND